MEIALLAGFLVLGVLSIGAWKRKSARARGVARLAAANGFTFSPDDHWASTRVPFATFRLGDNRLVENVVIGRAADGAPVRVFDHICWNERRTDDRVQRSGYRTMTCCLTETDVALPHLVLQPHTMATRFLARIGMPDILLESEEFNRRFLVRSEDEGFARRCVDPTMMDFLLSTEGRFQFELRGRWALVAAPQVPPHLFLSLVTLSTRFREAVPAVVRRHDLPLPEESGR